MNTKTKATEKEVNVKATEATEYTKQQLLASKKYDASKDIIQVVVADDELISVEKLDKRIDEFLNRKVK